MKFDFAKTKQDFPALKTDLAYLDNAATTQKPQVVLDALNDYYQNYCANIHRGIYRWSEQATEKYEAVRAQMARFIGGNSAEEIIFTSGATASLNMAARFMAQKLQAGDEILISRCEHHANLVPWQLVAKEYKLNLKWFDLDEQEVFTAENLKKSITDKTRVLCLTQMSNVSGYAPQVKEFTKIAHQHQITCVIDGAQSTPHFPVNVMEMDADFFCFSAHKMCGPTGVGVLYVKKELLNSLEPVRGGGGIIDDVELTHSTWTSIPHRFEAGTPPIAGVIGLSAALTYLQNLTMEAIDEYINELHNYALKQLSEISGLHLVPQTSHGILSFTIDGIHPHDIASVLDQENVAVRAGHHCAQPLMKHFGVPATIRASLYFYNTRTDVDRLVNGLKKTQKLLK
ncbi:MAG: hypothetical protein A2233_00910 [Candidatus Kerfeldbacteria bacterium RIFOXYA2_FULL_38_24]|uniref:cysteine desulfurase n=1 Tax=Candidatus Kerfeldbacteria bacterium RIFOXYB2_FULL_38_14 TaxID=1798547 RepID=A0A1G2BG29_9BACT|nr:MAG: hypothetical protein A2233_00910 [Candidatus Kerfeldbacteria bacterium RIFOXYA2_FULL_38_24]OGY88114.1 MAG: hypothetical protein A2319_01640 [Candidatus Kerfeldbacteria bacterium RIFOXYB2_FULL_38_14]OGY88733.1 MAG: hypothetical protein A2458_03085 [Candidatus Kerfeldbacteria bacterium RIFOXYC2_FULL_38_9]